MKIAVRIFALSVVVAGAAAALPSSNHVMGTSQAVSAKLPVPLCGPGMPHCPAQGEPSFR